MLKLYIKYFFYFMLIILSCSNGKDKSSNSLSITISRIQADITSNVLSNEAILNFFNAKNESGSYLIAGNGYDLKFNFSEPIYIEQIELHIDQQKTDKNYRPSTLRIEISPDDNSVPCDAIIYEVNYNKNIQQIDFKNSQFANIMRFRNLTIDIVKENGNTVDFGKKIFIKNINFKFSDKPLFRPSMTVKEIKKKYLKNIDNNKSWEFAFSTPLKPDEEILEIEIMRNLIYYALNGDAIAEKLFLSYNPSQADLGEIHATLIEWYEMTKEWKRTH